MKKALFCFGTRPETVKMAPLIRESRDHGFEPLVLLTGQHREMVTPFLRFFGLVADRDLNIMKANQSLTAIAATILERMEDVLRELKPDVVVVQGDTSSTFACALAAFYQRLPVAHIEAGLRTYDKFSPYPEEMNRKLVSELADFHFVPTEASRRNLEREGITRHVVVTGNTSIDSLRISLEKLRGQNAVARIEGAYPDIDFSKRLILVTAHRRENHGEPLLAICSALRRIAEEFRDEVELVFPVHLNPNVRGVVYERLSGLGNVHLLEPLSYEDFVIFMEKSEIIVSDSGGVQEEAPFLKRPVLVLRESTERPEGVEAGVSALVGTDASRIVEETRRLLTDTNYAARFTRSENPYGDGFAARKILSYLHQHITETR